MIWLVSIASNNVENIHINHWLRDRFFPPFIGRRTDGTRMKNPTNLEITNEKSNKNRNHGNYSLSWSS